MSHELGIAVHDITPPPGLPMGGYAARTGVARTTLDSLTCRAAVVHRNGAAVALIAVDLLYVRNPWAAAVRHRVAKLLGIDTSCVLVAATHTHAGPAVFRSAMHETGALSEYEDRLGDLVVAAVEEARSATRPVVLRWGLAVTEGVAANRQEEGRGFDASVRTLAASDVDGRLVGVIASFGCHPTVLSPSNLGYSRDLFGAAVDAAGNALGAPVLLFNGAAADVSTRFTRESQTPGEVARLGSRLADGIVAAVRASRVVAEDELAARTVDVALEPRHLPSLQEASASLASAVSALEEARGSASAAGIRRLTAHVEGAAAQLYLTQQGGIEAVLGSAPEKTTVQMLRLGGCDILGIPGEMFSEIGSQIYARRPRPALLAGYANDYVGYLVPSERAEGYEALISFVTETSATAIAETLARLGEGAGDERG